MNVIINGVNLKPGSHVLLTAPEGWDTEDIIDFKNALEESFSGVQFTFINGANIIGAYEAEPVFKELEW